MTGTFFINIEPDTYTGSGCTIAVSLLIYFMSYTDNITILQKGSILEVDA